MRVIGVVDLRLISGVVGAQVVRSCADVWGHCLVFGDEIFYDEYSNDTYDP